MSDSISPSDLPAYLNLPPHLSAHKYFFVCTLTVAAWDTLVLTPRSWKLLRTDGWPLLKIFYYFMRWFMPVEFIIVGVAFFDSSWTLEMCHHFFLFEPICTAILMAFASATHVIRIHAISNKNRSVLYGMGALLAVQIVVTAICCGFYRTMPLEEGQGCIAGPKANWVGIYWLAPTLLYTASAALAIRRSIISRSVKALSPWKLMLRDGLNLYVAIWGVNMANMLFWFIAQPEATSESPKDADTIKTIVTSMTAVITTTMTMRIILSVRGPLVNGGSYAGTSNSHSSGSNTASRGAGSRHTHPTAGVLQINPARGVHNTYQIQTVTRPDGEWEQNADQKSSINGGAEEQAKEKEGALTEAVVEGSAAAPEQGVKITVDREVK